VFFLMEMDPIGSREASGSAPMDRGRRVVSGLTVAGSVFVLPLAVDAGVIYSGLQNISLAIPVGQRPASSAVSGSSGAQALLDLDGDLTTDFGFVVGQSATSAGRYGIAFGQGNAAGFALDSGATAPFPIFAKFALGQTIGYPGGLWGLAGVARLVEESTSKASYGLTAGVPAYLGIAFSRSGNIHLGWLRLLVDDGPQGFPVSMTIMDWAWNEDPFGAIRAGEVPEANPALAMLAAAGTGLAAWRLGRRKKADGGEG
jgi:hypothetical protein